MSEEMERSLSLGCLLHSTRHRSYFQHVLNVTRGTVLPTKYIQLVGQTVCTCRRVRLQQEIDEFINYEGPENIKSSLEKLNKDATSEVKHAVMRAIDWSVKVKEGTSDFEKQNFDKSYTRFLLLLLKALKSDFSYLETNQGQSKEDKNITHNETFELPLESHHLGLLFGKEGRNIKPFCKLNNCVLKVLGRDADNACVKITILANDVQSLPRIKEELISSADRITLNRVAHEKRLTSFVTKRSMRRKANQGLTVAQSNSSSCKEQAEVNFSVKYHHMLKAKHQRERPSPTHILEEGSRCINCLVSYTVEDEDNPLNCRCHKGFVLPSSRKWSCCKLTITDTSTLGQMESHRDSGCDQTAHVWRLTRSDSVPRIRKGVGKSKIACSALRKRAGAGSGRSLVQELLDDSSV